MTLDRFAAWLRWIGVWLLGMACIGWAAHQANLGPLWGAILGGVWAMVMIAFAYRWRLL